MNQVKNVHELFVFCAATALSVFGVLVLWSAFQPARVLDGADPILPLSSRDVFYLAGGSGLAASAFLLAAGPQYIAAKTLLTAWLSVNYLAYAIGLRLTNGANLFSCLGNLNNRLPVSPKILDPILMFFFGGLLLESCLVLVFAWFARRKPAPMGSMPLAAPEKG